MKDEIVIKVIGKTGTGKSRILYILKRYLKETGFNVEFDGGLDFENESQFDSYMQENLWDALSSINNKTSIKFESIQSINNK